MMFKHSLTFGAGLIFLAFASSAHSEHSSASACGKAAHGQADCAARVLANADGPVQFGFPSGFTAAQLLRAYELPGFATGKMPPVLSVIIAFDAPTILHDLNYYSKTMEIPSLPSCKGPIAESATPCFQKLDQRGKRHFSKQTDWAMAASIGVESAHAICQNCSILLMESDDNWTNNLFPTVDKAADLGARFVDMGFVSYPDETKDVYDYYDTFFDHFPGVLFAAPSAGYAFAYPAASKFVTAVGTTALFVNGDGSYRSEAVGIFDGSHCDRFEAKPAWQIDTGCRNKMNSDVSMVGDLGTGLAIYCSTPQQCVDGGAWYLAGTPPTAMIAAVFALANHKQDEMSALPYEHYSPDNFHDVTKVYDKRHCKVDYFCKAETGYDGPTGLGSPRGIGGF